MKLVITVKKTYFNIKFVLSRVITYIIPKVSKPVFPE